MSATPSARAIERRLLAMRAPDRASLLQRFFKTGPGEYGEGDRFLGLTMPQVRHLAAEFAETPVEELAALLESAWHEVRMLSVVLMAARYPRADSKAQLALHRLYLRRTDRINNWDLVDVSAPTVVGLHLLTRSRAVLRRLARSHTLWERRIAIVSTLTFIRHDQFDDTIALAAVLMDDAHDLMHKAVGWMLREVGKRDQSVLCRFLDAHAATMPRTMLRYAIERLPVSRRRQYMDARSRM